VKRPIQVFNYSIQNQANNEVDIHIDGDIVDAGTQAIYEAWFGDDTSTSYKSFRNAIEKEPNAQVFNVIINSPGGHVGDALAIYDYLQELQNKGKTVNTKGRGIVASSGTLILMAGKSPEMSENTMWLMHDASSFCYGNVEDLEHQVAAVRKFNDKIRDLYASVSGQRKEDIAKLMKGEGTWLTAEDCLEKGFIKTVTGRATFENKIEADKWQYSDRSVLNKYNASVSNSNSNNLTEDMKKFFNDLKTEIVNVVKGTKIENNAKPEDIVNAIATGLGTAFDTKAPEFETEVTNHISGFFTGDAGKKLITDAVTAAIPTNLVKQEDFEALEEQVGQKLGAPTNSNDEKKDVKPIGGFA
jgi:ATP-dependent protease ClpP protease subunit